MREAVIVAMGRTAIGKAPKGKLRYTRPEDYGAEVLNAVLAKVPQLDHKEIDDVIIGCSMPEGEQGLNIGRVVAQRAGLPDCVPGQTVNRFCASGLQTIAHAANCIMVGQAEVIIAGGIESMSLVPMGGGRLSPTPYLMDTKPESSTSMGITAENVADIYGITREEQDAFGLESQLKAAKAQEEGKFKEEIIPVHAERKITDENGMVTTETFIFDQDEGIRPNSNIEKISKLRPAFKKDGTVTAANSSQTSDGAAMVLVMSKQKAESLGIKPLAIFRSFAVAGVPADVMGLGPIQAVPKALKLAGKTKEDIDLIELNEAFASQSIECIKELGLNKEIVNVNGGAIALGHPLGCTGTYLTIKLISELKRRNGKYGLVSMCIGGGMGAAAVIECV